MSARLRKGDRVVVISGGEKGKMGEIMQMRPWENTAVVRTINKRVNFQRPSATTEGGRIEREAPIHVSNLSIIDPIDGKPTKIGYKINDEGVKVRYAKRSGEEID